MALINLTRTGLRISLALLDSDLFKTWSVKDGDGLEILQNIESELGKFSLRRRESRVQREFLRTLNEYIDGDAIKGAFNSYIEGYGQYIGQIVREFRRLNALENSVTNIIPRFCVQSVASADLTKKIFNSYIVGKSIKAESTRRLFTGVVIQRLDELYLSQKIPETRPVQICMQETALDDWSFLVTAIDKTACWGEEYSQGHYFVFRSRTESYRKNRNAIKTQKSALNKQFFELTPVEKNNWLKKWLEARNSIINNERKGLYEVSLFKSSDKHI